MSKEIGFSEWRSTLDARDRGHVDARKAELARAASLFRTMREELGLTQVQAASRLETSQANVSKLEKRSTTDLNQISKLAGDEYEIVVVLRKKGAKDRKELEFAV